MEKTISLRIENKLIEKIDLMVKKGIYNDRSDLILLFNYKKIPFSFQLND